MWADTPTAALGTKHAIVAVELELGELSTTRTLARLSATITQRLLVNHVPSPTLHRSQLGRCIALANQMGLGYLRRKYLAFRVYNTRHIS